VEDEKFPACVHCGKSLRRAPVEGWWSLADRDEFDEAVERDDGSTLWCLGDPDSPRHEPKRGRVDELVERATQAIRHKMRQPLTSYVGDVLAGEYARAALDAAGVPLMVEVIEAARMNHDLFVNASGERRCQVHDSRYGLSSCPLLRTLERYDAARAHYDKVQE
jgi:hypothetical protein